MILLSPQIIKAIILGSTEDESGFDIYKQKSFPTLNNSAQSSGETRHSNVFIVVR